MVVEIMTKGAGSFYTSDGDVSAVKTMLDNGQLIDCWWYISNGRAFREKILFLEDLVAGIRTDSDGIPPTEERLLG